MIDLSSLILLLCVSLADQNIAIPKTGPIPIIRRRSSLGSTPSSNSVKIMTRTSNRKYLSLEGDDDSTATVHRNINGLNTTDVLLGEEPRTMKASRNVRFAPLPPGTMGASKSSSNHPTQKGKGFRRDYSLGETVRCTSHMIPRPTISEQAFQSINTLKNRDFAFVKRPSSSSSLDDTSSSFSYAILACRSLEPPIDSITSQIPSPETLEECMVFVMCDAGSTVKLRKDQWVDYIRLVSMEGSSTKIINTKQQQRQTSTNDGDTMENDPKGDDGDWIPPNIISFIPTNNEDGISGITSSSAFI